ncbi:MAG: phosphatidylethanolamine-binding protein [Actinobacteria bacterium]|nr:MAG: phosphatidylethanolamine-binding protein [Actinomycetota bacterium]
MPARPGSKRYDSQRARLRKAMENAGHAADADANAVANEILQERQGRAGILRSERGLGPKSEPARGERR